MEGDDYEEERNSQELYPDKYDEEVVEAKIAYFLFNSERPSPSLKVKSNCSPVKNADSSRPKLSGRCPTSARTVSTSLGRTTTRNLHQPNSREW